MQTISKQKPIRASKLQRGDKCPGPRKGLTPHFVHAYIGTVTRCTSNSSNNWTFVAALKD
ncbi:hypothetical protein HCJ07_06880 [Listeria booriae]|nr:hypothetical protein [Listeria booriae]